MKLLRGTEGEREEGCEGGDIGAIGGMFIQLDFN